MLGSENPQATLTDTASFCSQLLRPGSIYAFLAEHRSELFSESAFLHLYPSHTGRPSLAPSLVASVMVLQSLEGLSDREAIEALRANLYWKLACGVPLDHEGFSHNVLVLWRNRIRESERPSLIFEIVSEVVKGTGLLSGKKRRALDSTVLSDAVLTQDTFMQLTSQIRRVRKLIPELESVPLEGDYSIGVKRPLIDYSDEAEKSKAVTTLVNDATALVDWGSSLELDTPQSEALGLLAVLVGQDVEVIDEVKGVFAVKVGVAKDRVISTVDPEARHVHKSRAKMTEGFKGHIAVEPTTEVITQVTLAKGNVSDGSMGEDLLKDEQGGLIVYGDSAYSSASFRGHLETLEHQAVIKPHPLRSAVPGGYTVDDFTLDLENSTLTCPASWCVPISKGGRASFVRHCAQCPLRGNCTTSKKGRVVVMPRGSHLNRQARAEFASLKEDYNIHRPVVERVHAQMKRKMSGSKLRYRGVAKNAISYSTIAAVWNLKVLIRNGLSYHDGTWVIAT